MRHWTTPSYREFKERVEACGWTMEQLRGDVRHTPELLTFLYDVGINRWERYVTRLERERECASS